MLNPEIYSLNLSNFTHFYHHCIFFAAFQVVRLRNLTVYRLWAKNGAWFGEPSWHSDVAMFFVQKKAGKIYSDSPIFTGKRMQIHVEKKAGKKYHFFHILCGSVTLEMFFWERSWHTLLNILIKFGQVNQVQPGSWTVLPKGWNSDTSKMWNLFECNFGISFGVF